MKRTEMKITSGLLALGMLSGCATPASRPVRPGPHRPEVPTKTDPMPDEEPNGMLSIEQALAAVLMRNPDLSAYSYRVRAAEAHTLQARLLPNPELGVEVDEYNRDGAGFDSAESTVALAQLFELGGKRGRRIHVAEASGELVSWDYESKRLDVLSETTQRFFALLAAQERVELAVSSVELAEKTSIAVAERVKAGKEPPFQKSKSDAELEMARMNAQTAQSRLEVARKRLAAMWGAEEAAFDRAQGRLDRRPDPVPALTDLRTRLNQNPDIARWESELRLRRAALDSERANRIPDLKASVGFKQYEEDGTDALMFGVSMPLPLFDRNQGNIAVATHELSRAEDERSAIELKFITELSEVHSALTAAHQRVTTLKNKVVPAMEEAYDAVQTGYREGKFGILDLLDAQRKLFEAQASLIDGLSDYHIALINLKRALGINLDELM